MTFTMLILVSTFGFAAEPQTQQDDAEAEKARIKKWGEFYASEAAQYEFLLDNDSEHKLKLESPSVLQYTNPERAADQHGAIYVWTWDGRPEVIGSIWSSLPRDNVEQRTISHEFQSLSLRPVVSKHAPRVGRNGTVPDWSPRAAGIELHVIADAPAPAAQPVARLAQMRRLVAEFSAKITLSDVEAHGNLRLLTQPLTRYSSKSAGVSDGALFAYVQATDPELILLVEARETSDGPRWHFAAARFTNRPLQLMHQDREVWSCSKAPAFVGDQTYFLYWGVSTRSRSLD